MHECPWCGFECDCKGFMDGSEACTHIENVCGLNGFNCLICGKWVAVDEVEPGLLEDICADCRALRDVSYGSGAEEKETDQYMRDFVARSLKNFVPENGDYLECGWEGEE